MRSGSGSCRLGDKLWRVTKAKLLAVGVDCHAQHAAQDSAQVEGRATHLPGDIIECQRFPETLHDEGRGGLHRQARPGGVRGSLIEPAGPMASGLASRWRSRRTASSTTRPSGSAAAVINEGSYVARTVRLESIGDPESGWPLSHVDYEALRSSPTSLQDIAAASYANVHVAGIGDAPERLQAQIVTPNYFDVLGVEPAAGRPFSSDASEESRMVVVSHRLARRAFGSASAALGVELTINGALYTIAGVAPGDFAGHRPLRGADLWLPASAAPELLHSPLRRTCLNKPFRPSGVRFKPKSVRHRPSECIVSVHTQGHCRHR